MNVNNNAGHVGTNIILGCVCMTLLLWKSSKYYIFQVHVCTLSYPACQAHVLYNTVICGLPAVPYFPTLSHKWHDFWKSYWPNFRPTHFSFQEELHKISLMYIGLHIKYLLVLSDFNQTWIFIPDFKKISTKFHGNPFSGSQDVPCRKTGRGSDGQTWWS